MGACKAGNVNTVTVVTDHIFTIQKGNVTMCVAHEGRVVIVFDVYQKMEDNLPFVALAKVYEKPSDAYKKCMYLVGKLCRKDYNSKYFRSHQYKEHLNNGNVSYSSEEAEVMAFVMKAYETVSSFLENLAR